LEQRRALVELGSAHDIDEPRVSRALAEARPAPEALAKRSELDAQHVPDTVAEALGSERPLPDATWSALSPLDRYALVKVVERGNEKRLDAAYREIVGHSAVATHLGPDGAARMVGIAAKQPTHRRAVARSRVTMNERAFERLQAADAPKGDVLGTARLAAIMASKRTSELIPLCHPISLTRVDVEFEVDEQQRAVHIEVSAEAVDRTGVEMEAMVAASVCALTIYDMLKALDRGILVGPTLLVSKSGGRSGDYRG
jgi:cyclic pyranopterin phosphate synthase